MPCAFDISVGALIDINLTTENQYFKIENGYASTSTCYGENALFFVFYIREEYYGIPIKVSNIKIEYSNLDNGIKIPSTWTQHPSSGQSIS